MEYIKVFETHAEYETYINSLDKILPNLSYCENLNDVHLNPIETRIVAKFNITDTANPTFIFNNPALLNEVEIDGVVQPSVVTSYTFETTGLHTVKFKLNDNVTTLDNGSFGNKSNLIGISIPNSITTIDQAAFAGCISLTTVKIGNSVTTIGNTVFGGCTSLTSVGGIGSGASIEIPNSVTSIGIGAFNGCSGLTSVTIPDSVTSIGNSAFSGCTGLTSITIPNSITTIGESVFSDCSGLTNIIIGNGITSIGHSTFFNCTSITSITIQAINPPSAWRDSFPGTYPLYVPAESVDVYKAADEWSHAANINRIQAIPTT